MAALAVKYSLPTLLDAAADTPPVENLRRYTQMGYDLVAFSGGKAIRGPQDSGLLVGRRLLIQAAKRNAAPMKGQSAASPRSARRMLSRSGAPRSSPCVWRPNPARCEQQLRTLESILDGLPTVRCHLITPKVANQFPHLRIEWDQSAWKLDSERLAILLRNGSPPIATRRVFGTGDSGLLISAVNLRAGEERVVGERIPRYYGISPDFIPLAVSVEFTPTSATGRRQRLLPQLRPTFRFARHIEKSIWRPTHA